MFGLELDATSGVVVTSVAGASPAERAGLRPGDRLVAFDGGAPVRMAGSLTDLTERKLSEARLRDNLQIIARQQEAIQVLSTPIIEVWEGVLTVPILTAVDAERAAVMTHTILDTVSRTRCRHLILDLTGVQSIESETADRIIRLIRAAGQAQQRLGVE